MRAWSKNARTVGDYARRGLESLATKHDLIGDVRGSGLFLGAELVQDRTSKEPAVEETRRIVNGMRERGVLIGDTGMYDNVLKIRPRCRSRGTRPTSFYRRSTMS